MPRYLSLGTIPEEAAHRAPHRARLQGRGHLLRGSRHHARVFAGLQHRLPPAAADAGQEGRGRPATGAVERSRATGAAAPPSQDRRSCPATGDPVTGRVPLLTNRDVTLWRCRPAKPQAELYRNATADEILFVHRGRGDLLTHVRRAAVQAVRLRRHPALHDVPISTSTRGRAARPAGHRVAGNSRLPAALPQPRRPAPPRCRRTASATCTARPSYSTSIDAGARTRPVLIKDGERLTRYTLAHHPFDVVGWDGLVYPFTFNADDFEPITGTIHQPPPIHQTFEAPGFVVCTFAPRMLDTHPDAIKVPYAHSNVESDEVLYYVRGQFGSRRGVEEASFTLHPHGIPHGPHPGTIAASQDVTRTDELAVMVDTFRPLYLTKQAMELDDASYPLSWLD